MVLTIVALLLFLAMVAGWVILPGSMMALPMEESAAQYASSGNAESVPAPTFAPSASANMITPKE